MVDDLLGAPTSLTQYGLDDTVLDLVYNTIGRIIVALVGTTRLTGVSNELLVRFENRGT